MFFKSALSVLALTTTVAALSLRTLQTHRPCAHVGRRLRTALHLEDRSDNKSGTQRELESLQSRRDQLKKASIANTKPDDDKPRVVDIDKMSTEEFREYMAASGNADIGDSVEAMLAGELTFKTKRVAPSPTRAKRERGSKGKAGTKAKEGGDEEETFRYVDYNNGSWDENDFHIPNRIGFTTADWADTTKGFVNGKLKKTDRKMGKFNKSDLKKAYNKLQQSGVTFIETSESFPKSDSLFSKVNKEVELRSGPDVASTFPNPWKHALRNRSRPRAGAGAVCTAAEKACERLGVTSMTLFQVENPWYYLGGTSALAQGMLEVIQEGHAPYVGCVDMSVSKLYKIHRYLKEKEEFVATNQFEFSLTNRKNMGMIETCKKLGITPICRNVLDGGLASGRYTPTNPTGGEVSKGEGDTGPYTLRKLEKLDALFKTMESLSESVSKRVKSDLLNFDASQRPDINTAITTTQIAINYVRAMGAVPLLSVTNPRAANELLGCLGWDLNEEELEELDKACKTCGL